MFQRERKKIGIKKNPPDLAIKTYVGSLGMKFKFNCERLRNNGMMRECAPAGQLEDVSPP